MRRILSSVFRTLTLVLGLCLSSCNTLKFVPEDKCLLTQVKIVDTDGKPVSDVSSYLRQKPNSKVLGFWPLQLQIYNTAPRDTLTRSQRRLRRNAFKMGEAPEIYDPLLTASSMREIRQALVNRGYFNCSVDTQSVVSRRRVKLRYIVSYGARYSLRSYSVDLPDGPDRLIATDAASLPAKGQPFSSGRLDEERARIATEMRNDGFYYYEKNVLDYEADSSWRNNEISVTLQETEQVRHLPDSLYRRLRTRMYIRSVSFVQGQRKFLRDDVLRRYCVIRPGQAFSEKRVERTYARLNALGAVRYIDVAFRPVGGTDSLDCIVTLSRNKINSVSAEIEGTYSGGDWGIAAGASYVNRNIFRGSEQLSVDLSGSYEWRQNGGRAIEGKADVSLSWPNQLRVGVGITYQNRPDEYVRTMARAALEYGVQRYRSRWHHQFGLVDISYIRLPWISKEYREKVIDKSSILRYSYEDHLIFDFNYSGFYSGKRSNQPYRDYVDFRYSVETAGNFLYAVSRIGSLPRDSAGVYSIFDVNFAQYVKGDIQFSYHQFVSPKHQLVYHAAIGVAMPYLNSRTIPFEKRYFAGGSNSVRGWQSRTLGPGTYHGVNNMLRYDLQAGDIKLDLNFEYRWRVVSILELAAFTDAGNVWTIRDYDSQPGGLFRFDRFFREIAWSYGGGIRLDFSVLILRVDLGVKLYDPTRLETDGKVWRTSANGLRWRNDCTFHFAIGYPF